MTAPSNGGGLQREAKENTPTYENKKGSARKRPYPLAIGPFGPRYREVLYIIFSKCQVQNKKRKEREMELKNLPELLAPAGSPDALYAAIDVSEKKR